MQPRQLWRFMSGTDAIDRLRRNPYVPASLMDWKAADRVGQRLLREVDAAGDLESHPARLQGALNSVWRELLAKGDTAGTEERVRSLLEARGVNAEQTLQAADENGSLKRLGDLLRVPGAAWLEDQVTAALSAMEAVHQPLSVRAGQELGAVVWDAEAASGLKLTDEQRAAVTTLLVLPVAALQGGAGVGKTTVMKVLATAWEDLGGNVVFGALAGKAALALSRGASNPQAPRLAFTVARLIGMFERQRAQESNPEVKRPGSDVTVYERTLLVIDEAGMLDTPSLYRLLKLLPAGARLLLAGDDGQLPPVGIGQVFHDIVADGTRVVTLTKVLRQAADSEIPTVANSVRNGKTAGRPLWNGESKGVYLLPGSQLAAAQRLLRAQGELLVIAAKRATVSSLNDSEANYAHSPGDRVRRLGPLATVAVGDPVVMTVNRFTTHFSMGC
jgi:exodeoxyribonuclease V alpha subunit